MHVIVTIKTKIIFMMLGKEWREIWVGDIRRVKEKKVP